MIVSFRNEATRRLYEQARVAPFAGLDVKLVFKRFALLNAITSLNEIPKLRSIHLHALKGSRHGQFAISVNGGWRICFEFQNGHAENVEVVDYRD
ncbi:MAG: type II toxin-antitoxin system RelE/ParE family toxin [Candidatus Binataceae bacterium]